MRLIKKYWIITAFSFVLFSCESNKQLDEIEYIDYTFNKGYLNSYSVKIVNDSCFVDFSLDDSIGTGLGKMDKNLMDSINQTINSIKGSFSDVSYPVCAEYLEYYQLIIKRNNSKIEYHGGNCRINRDFDKIAIIINDLINSRKLIKGGKKLTFESKLSVEMINKLKGN